VSDATPTEQAAALKRRRQAARKYRPDVVELLLVAEAPPCELSRYFYFEDVPEHDWLFRYVWEGLTGEKPSRAEKAHHLAALQRGGVYLIDLHEENISQPTAAQLTPKVSGLIDRCRELRPKRIVLIKSIVHDVAFQPLKDAGFNVVDERIPFPASGQQRKFLESFRRSLQESSFVFRP
jgi:hypothetical protein